ncbi:SH3 domain-containing protein [Flavonifractor plautii]|uniref:SH3 domain-containing protein n=2 Tax=Flavonifractor plautii TaxID=292800 RepID=UPI0030B94499
MRRIWPSIMATRTGCSRSRLHADPMIPVLGKSRGGLEMENHAAGVVANCLRAALYQEPRANSKVLTVITALTRVSVNMDEPTDAFYKVSTSNGTQGYCMKKFIAVRR